MFKTTSPLLAEISRIRFILESWSGMLHSNAWIDFSCTGPLNQKNREYDLDNPSRLLKGTNAKVAEGFVTILFFLYSDFQTLDIFFTENLKINFTSSSLSSFHCFILPNIEFRLEYNSNVWAGWAPLSALDEVWKKPFWRYVGCLTLFSVATSTVITLRNLSKPNSNDW